LTQLEIDRDRKSRKAEKQSNNALRIEPVIVVMLCGVAQEMMMLAAKDPMIAAGRAASGDDLTEAEKGKLLSLVSKCVSMISALQHLGKYIAMEQSKSLIMGGQRQAALDSLRSMMSEMQVRATSCNHPCCLPAWPPGCLPACLPACQPGQPRNCIAVLTQLVCVMALLLLC
jgi:hypothetical protein